MQQEKLWSWLQSVGMDSWQLKTKSAVLKDHRTIHSLIQTEFFIERFKKKKKRLYTGHCLEDIVQNKEV